MNEKQQGLFRLGRELGASATDDGWSVLTAAPDTAKNHLAQAFGILCWCADSAEDARAIIVTAQSVRNVTGLDVLGDIWARLGDAWPEIFEDNE